MPKIKAAAYARYSTDNQTDNSIAYQMDSIRTYCQENNIDLVAEFIDEGETGTNAEREGFRTLCLAASLHEFDAVVIYDISRGSRDVGDWFTFRKLMLTLGVKVITTTGKLGDLTNANDFLVELVNVGMGQREVLANRQKALDGVRTKALQGQFLGGKPPLGYDTADGRYIINPYESSIVQKIFAMYANGSSYNDIIGSLNGARGKRGGLIGKNSLNNILRNERYIGTYTWNKLTVRVLRKYVGKKENPRAVTIENAIPPIIDEPTWQAVQQRVNSNQRNAYNKARVEYLLSGLIECNNCGAAYVGHCSRNTRGYATRSYNCGGRYRTKSCQAKSVNADRIEKFVLDHLKDFLQRSNFDKLAQFIVDKINNDQPNLSKEKAELVDIQSKIQNAIKAILSGVDFPELQDEVSRLRDRKSELEKIISTSRPRRSINKNAVIEFFKASIQNWKEENLKNIIRQHIMKITVKPDGSYKVIVGVHSNGDPGRT